jgi:hypothetical protein
MSGLNFPFSNPDDNIFRFVQAGSEVSFGFQGRLATRVVQKSEREGGRLLRLWGPGK